MSWVPTTYWYLHCDEPDCSQQTYVVTDVGCDELSNARTLFDAAQNAGWVQVGELGKNGSWKWRCPKCDLAPDPHEGFLQAVRAHSARDVAEGKP